MNEGVPNKIEDLKVKVEVATPADWEAYKKIRLESIYADGEAFDMDNDKLERENKKTDSEWQDDIKNQIIILSKNDSKPVGLVRGSPKKDGSWGIHYVYLNKDFRKGVTGMSIAEDMMKKVLEKIKEEEKIKLDKGEKVEVWLWVKESRKPAIELYDKLGFNKITDKEKALEFAGGDEEYLIGWQPMELYL